MSMKLDIKNCKAVCCDLDGTLVASGKVWGEAMAAILREKGQEATPEQGVKIWSEFRAAPVPKDREVGGVFDEFRRYVKEKMGTEVAPEEYKESCGPILQQIKLKDGVVDMLKQLKQASKESGFTVALTTTQPMEILEFYFQNNWVNEQLGKDEKTGKAGFQHIFDRIYCGDTKLDGKQIVQKPAPDLYIAAMKDMGLQPSEVIALEDDKNGASAALSAGINRLCIVDKSTLEKGAQLGGVNFVSSGKSLEENMKVIDSLLPWEEKKAMKNLANLSDMAHAVKDYKEIADEARGM